MRHERCDEETDGAIPTRMKLALEPSPSREAYLSGRAYRSVRPQLGQSIAVMIPSRGTVFVHALGFESGAAYENSTCEPPI